MSITNINETGLEILRKGQLPVLPQAALKSNSFPDEYRELYEELVDKAISEFPPIEGYAIMHATMVERMAYMFVAQKIEDAKTSALDIDMKRYRLNIQSFLRTCETLLKEARTISSEKTFKHKFIHDVLEILDRCVSIKKEKKQIAVELNRLAIG